MGDINISIQGSFRVYRIDGSYAEVPCTRHVMVCNGGQFPAMTLLQNGELLSVVRGGAGHIGREGRLDIVKSDDGGETWSEPETIINSEYDDRNPVLGQLRDSSIVLVYMRYWNLEYGTNKEYSDWEKSRQKMWFTRSSDNGRTWESPKKVPVPPGFYATVSPAGGQKIIQISDGTVLFTGGLLRTKSDPWYGVPAILRSTDSGRSWGDATVFDIGPADEEVALLELPSGRLLAALRGGGVGVGGMGGHAVWISESDDSGRRWSSPPRKVTDEWQHPADLLLLSNGWVLLTFGSRHIPYGVRALVSYDEGHTWDDTHNIVLVDNCKDSDCGYPTTLALPDGCLITCYYRTASKKSYFEGLGETCIAAVVKYKEADLLTSVGDKANLSRDLQT